MLHCRYSVKRKTMSKIFSWMHQDLEVRDTERYGKGVFVTKAIKAGELLTVFGGYVVTIQEEKALAEEFQDTGLQIGENFIITTKDRSEDSDCFNHSCNPNAGYKGQIFLVAMRDLQVGEEVVFDYAMVLYARTKEDEYVLECGCHSDNCRGKVSTEDWKNVDLQKKYAGYFQYFIQEKINILKNSYL